MTKLTKKMEKGNARLLRAAEIMRTVAKTEDFSMYHYHVCGTPSCVLGYYAADPKTPFRIPAEKERNWIGYSCLIRGSAVVDLDSSIVLNHFAVSEDEAEELFGAEGCADAQTPVQAAEYIERFVRNRQNNERSR